MFIPRADYSNPEAKIVFFTGAGLSADSGISTFRDSDGLWENHKIEEVCSEGSWKKNFETVHKFYNERREELNGKEPNAAHIMIKEIQEEYQDDCIVITQNVDNLLEKAGIPEDKILHVHGNLTKLKCENCGNNWDIGFNTFDIKNDRCPKCDSLKAVRPNIVFFGGQAPMYSYMHRAFEYLQNPNSIFIVIGTMGNVIHISSIIGTKSLNGKVRKTIPCHTILNNLDENEYLEKELFNDIFYLKASIAADKIKEIIKDKFKKS